MNKQDQIQQEAIRKLAKISATRSGGFRIDPAAEQKEKDRISRLVDPDYKSPEFEASNQGRITNGFYAANFKIRSINWPDIVFWFEQHLASDFLSFHTRSSLQIPAHKRYSPALFSRV